MRLADSLVDIANVIENIPSDFQPATRNEAVALQALSQSSIVGNLVPGGVYTPAGALFTSVGDILAPVALRGDRFTAYQNTPLNMPAGDFNLTGTGSRSDPPPAVFAPEDVVLLTDGTCGSTCTIFSYLMVLEAGVKTVTAGGRPRAGPIQAIAGVEGAQVFYLSDIARAASAALVLADSASGQGQGQQQQQLAAGQVGLLARGYAIRRAADPANAGSVNGKNAFGKADAQTPFQFLYEPANCRFFYTADMLGRPEAAWERAVDATWTDPAGLCVEGSRVPMNQSQAVDPTFMLGADGKGAAGTGQSGGSGGDGTDAASVAGDSSDDPDVVSAAVRSLGRGRGYRAVALAGIAAMAWLWVG